MTDSLVLFMTALIGAFIVALWISIILWTARDARARSDDRLVQILAVVVTAVLGPAGLLLYLLLRPAQTLEEAYQSSLEEETLLAALAGRTSCPGCGRQTEPEWMLCPSCTTALRKPCLDCRKPLELAWAICPYCGAAEGKAEPADD